jgi:hypothetical protein
MKPKTILIVIVLGVTWLATPVAAQDDKNPPKTANARFGDPTSTARNYQGYLYGVIKELKENEMVLVKTKFGTDQTFKLNKKTKFSLNGKTSSLDKLNVGDKVWVNVQKDKKTGDMIAKRVVSGVDIPAAP